MNSANDRRRLLTAISGVTAVYNYDAVGNLTSIDRFTPLGSGISIYLAAPGSGPATTQVTIEGYGFDPTPANNTVVSNGPLRRSTSCVCQHVGRVRAHSRHDWLHHGDQCKRHGDQSTIVYGACLADRDERRPGDLFTGSASGGGDHRTYLPNATAVTFTRRRVACSASIRDGGTATTLPISFTVASSVPAGNYAFTVTSPAASSGSAGHDRRMEAPPTDEQRLACW
ncbi:MAG: hypothetical protein U0231_04550 [Nitrospiraceae bacterium]